MTSQLLEELKAIGVEVIPQGTNLPIRPASKVPVELKERLKAHKAEVLEAQNGRPGTCSPSCYQIEPRKWIHHPWQGCTTSAMPKREYRRVEAQCWHCSGAGACACITCAEERALSFPQECRICHGSRKALVWVT